MSQFSHRDTVTVCLLAAHARGVVEALSPLGIQVTAQLVLHLQVGTGLSF